MRQALPVRQQALRGMARQQLVPIMAMSAEWCREHFVLMLFLALSFSPLRSKATCNTDFTEIFLNKEEPYEYNGRPARLTCYRKVMIRKCEGTCTSEVSPSVVRFPGFKKVSII